MTHKENPDKWSQLPIDTTASDFKPDVFSDSSISPLAKKAAHVLRISESGQHFDLTREQSVNVAHQELQLARGLFKELAEVYGIPNAGFRPFIADSDGKPRAMVATSYIEGTTIQDEADIPQTHKVEARKLLNNLTDYVLDKFHAGSVMLTDIFRTSQYVLDSRTGRFILVDTDPYVEDTIYSKQRASRELREIAHRVLEGNELKDWYARMEPVDSAEPDVHFDEDF